MSLHTISPSHRARPALARAAVGAVTITVAACSSSSAQNPSRPAASTSGAASVSHASQTSSASAQPDLTKGLDTLDLCSVVGTVTAAGKPLHADPVGLTGCNLASANFSTNVSIAVAQPLTGFADVTSTTQTIAGRRFTVRNLVNTNRGLTSCDKRVQLSAAVTIASSSTGKTASAACGPVDQVLTNVVTSLVRGTGTHLMFRANSLVHTNFCSSVTETIVRTALPAVARGSGMRSGDRHICSWKAGTTTLVVGAAADAYYGTQVATVGGRKLLKRAYGKSICGVLADHIPYTARKFSYGSPLERAYVNVLSSSGTADCALAMTIAKALVPTLPAR